MSYNGKKLAYTAKNDSLIRALIANPLYRVDSDGTVHTRINSNGIGVIPNDGWRRCDNMDKAGYMVVNVSRYSKGKRYKRTLRAHRIVFQKFNGELMRNKVVNHIDGNKANNKPDNLELILPEENTSHALEILGHSPIRNTVISMEIAMEIRQLRREGWKYEALVEKFDISKGHVSDIVNNKIWIESDSHVPF